MYPARRPVYHRRRSHPWGVRRIARWNWQTSTSVVEATQVETRMCKLRGTTLATPGEELCKLHPANHPPRSNPCLTSGVEGPAGQQRGEGQVGMVGRMFWVPRPTGREIQGLEAAPPGGHHNCLGLWRTVSRPSGTPHREV